MTQDITTRDTHDLSREKIDLIKQTVARGATDLELELFLHACKRTGLDPLMKQVYAIKRWNESEKREVMSFQTGIDGYRLIADRTGRYAGSDEPTYMLSEDGFPEVASVTVYKMIDGQRCGFSASARWKEYVQKKRDGSPTSMWVKMPFLMLGKCAEALALRKAFPAELSGIYTHEEMMQADNVQPAQTVMDNKRAASAAINELRAASAAPPSADQAEGGGQGTTSLQPPPSLNDNPATPYRRTLASTDPTVKAIKAWWDSVPDELKQDLFADYKEALKSVKG